MGNIEGLKKEVDEIKNSLNALKNNVSISDPEKKSQIESIKSQAEIVKEKIQKEISSLENKGDDISKQAKEEAQALLDTFDKITSLYNSITNTPKNEPSIQSQQPETESKDIFSKAKDWIGEQRDNVWDEEKWKTEGGKNLLRTAGFMATGIGAVSLAYKGIKKLLGRGKDEDENDKEDDNTSKEKSFWDTGLGKTLAWLGIGSATGGGIYFLGKKFNRWNNSDDKPADNGSTHTEGGNGEKSKVDNSGDKYEIDQFNITVSPEFQKIWENLKGEEKPELEPFACTLNIYNSLKSQGKLKNTKYLTVVDFTKEKSKNRMFVINTETRTVEYAVKCGHGKGSGAGKFATSFGNKGKSGKSSLGGYITPDKITKTTRKSGWYGLRQIHGIESSNSSAGRRGIAIHPGGLNGSDGCFTIPKDVSNEIMNKQIGGSLLFAYAKSKDYFTQSKFFKQDSNDNFIA